MVSGIQEIVKNGYANKSGYILIICPDNVD